MRGKVAITSQGIGCRVEVNGTDLTDAVNGVTISMSPSDFNKVELDLACVEVTSFESEEAELLIPRSTHEALVALGWKPPEET